MSELLVELGDLSYSIYINSNREVSFSQVASHIKGRQVCIVTNTRVAELYLDPLKKNLDQYDLLEVVLADGEQFKVLSTIENIIDQLLQAKHNRTTTLIALGGGVVGDMTGFAASCYQRGVAFIQIPTTLLAQVDSSVGGKTGVNHALGKNMIGAFYQPETVIIDTQLLQSLPKRQLSAGIAEIIKYGLIRDSVFYQWLKEHLQSLYNKDEQALDYAIYRSCYNKAKIVQMDEKEVGCRAVLNLGHSFAHAIETFQQYNDWLHGEAVAVGLVMAMLLSQKLGYVELEEVTALQRLLESVCLPISPPKGMKPNDFLNLMILDKKVLSGKIRLVLLQKIGYAYVTDDFDHHLLQLMLKEVCH